MDLRANLPEKYQMKVCLHLSYLGGIYHLTMFIEEGKTVFKDYNISGITEHLLNLMERAAVEQLSGLLPSPTINSLSLLIIVLSPKETYNLIMHRTLENIKRVLNILHN
jgi:hypothetical protein